jgi:hypothetical protein
MMRWLLLNNGGRLHRLLGHDFKDHADGSLYLRILVTPTDSGNGELHVSYHASGQVNFRGPFQGTTHCEPTFSITRRQPLLVVSLADITRLKAVDAPGKGDEVLELRPVATGPVAFALAIAADMGPPAPGVMVITYPEWFRLLVEPIAPLPMNEGAKGRALAANGLYPNALLAPDEALIRFQQKRQGGQGLIFNWEPNTGVLRIIFETPMRVPPEATLIFERDDVVAEPIKITTAEARFRLKGRGGYLKEPVPITSLVLDAEL